MRTKTAEQIETHVSTQEGSSRFKTALLIVGVVLLAINLRACITAVGPWTSTIRNETGLSDVLVSLLTALPLIAFGAFSPLASRMGRRWGIERMLLVSLLGLTVGILLRSLPVISLLFLGTALLGGAIAISNVLLPSLIKRDFPQQIGLMTGLYSTLIGVGGALADGVSIPLAQGTGLGWRGSLAFWALPAALTTLLWLLLLRSRSRQAIPQAANTPGRRLWRSALAWQITLFMGLQSLGFYIVITWFPVIFQSAGLSAANAGWMISLLQFAGVLSSFLTPLLAGRMHGQRMLVAWATLLNIIGYLGILSGMTSLIALWCVLLGLAQGAYLSLALMFFILRTQDTHSAAALSGMAQAVGYLLAACGPLLFGWLHDLTNAWTIPLLALLLVALILLGTGMGAGRDIVVVLIDEQPLPGVSKQASSDEI